ncbi:MAG: outer membrane protein assembly factor BamA [Alphaproteobacteria bacterium]
MTRFTFSSFRFYVFNLFFTLAVLTSIGGTPVWASQVVERILITGTQRIEPSTVSSYIDLKVGDRVDSSVTDRALKNLFATGLFADVKVDNKNGVIEIEVVENPVVHIIAFEGNERIDDDALRQEIQLSERQVFTRSKVQADVKRLNQLYRRQGRFSVSIQPKIIRLDQNRVNLVFEIQEGQVTKVESIRFIGNQVYSDSKLRSIISTKESAWYRFLSSSDRYDPDRLSYDQELLRDFYLEQGYADFQIPSAVAELSEDEDGFYITVTVEEGERYKVDGINIQSAIRDFDASILYDDVMFEKGDWYNAEEVKDTVERMIGTLGDLQYAFVDIRPDLSKDRAQHTVDITFYINETPRVFVERINVNGNLRTLDKVIRREMELVEGDPFNRSKLAQSERNIRNLDFFETSQVKMSRGSAPDRSVIDVNVEEKSTGELSVGAGFSTSDGPLADFGVRERNFLGRGQDLRLGAMVAGEKTQFDVSFTEPYFLDRDLSAGFDAYHTTTDYQDESSYDQKKTGGALRIGYPLSENWRQTLTYKALNNEIYSVDADASRFIREQEGERTTSALSQRLTYDTRDSAFMTTRGLNYWLETEVAGLGGDARYISGETGASYYYPIADQWVLNILGETGAIAAYSGSDVEINERFFLGGSSLRGFESSGVGPRDILTKDSLGGNTFYRGSAEMSFPLGLPKELGIRGHAFTDFGSLFNLDEAGATIVDEGSLRAAGGFGLSWRSPLGPIRLDFAIPYLKEDYDEEEHFRFDFGTRF